MPIHLHVSDLITDTHNAEGALAKLDLQAAAFQVAVSVLKYPAII